MAKRARAVRRRSTSAGTFIQRSRGVSSELKATFHQVTGAGRRGTLRRFLGIAPADEPALRTAFEKAIRARLAPLQT